MDIVGICSNNSRTPLSGVEISLYRNDNLVAHTESDSTGFYCFKNTMDNDYRMTATFQQTTLEKSIIASMSNIICVNNFSFDSTHVIEPIPTNWVGNWEWIGHYSGNGQDLSPQNIFTVPDCSRFFCSDSGLWRLTRAGVENASGTLTVRSIPLGIQSFWRVRSAMSNTRMHVNDSLTFLSEETSFELKLLPTYGGQDAYVFLRPQPTSGCIAGYCLDTAWNYNYRPSRVYVFVDDDSTSRRYVGAMNTSGNTEPTFSFRDLTPGQHNVTIAAEYTSPYQRTYQETTTAFCRMGEVSRVNLVVPEIPLIPKRDRQ